MSYLDPSPLTEGLYEARSLPVSTVRLQIPPRFVDRMAVSYGCKEKFHLAAAAAALSLLLSLSQTHTLGEAHLTYAYCVLTHLSFRERIAKSWLLVLELQQEIFSIFKKHTTIDMRITL